MRKNMLTSWGSSSIKIHIIEWILLNCVNWISSLLLTFFFCTLKGVKCQFFAVFYKRELVWIRLRVSLNEYSLRNYTLHPVNVQKHWNQYENGLKLVSMTVSMISTCPFFWRMTIHLTSSNESQ